MTCRHSFVAPVCHGLAVSLLILTAVLAHPPLAAAFEGIGFERNDEVWLTDGAGTGERMLADGYGYQGQLHSMRDPAVSPNGQYVALVDSCDNCFFGFDSLVVHTDGCDHSVAGNVNVRWQNPSFNPVNSRQLAVSAWVDGAESGADIWRINWQFSDGFAEGMCPTGVVSNGGLDAATVQWNGDQRNPSWSPTGSLLVFDSTHSPAGTAFADGNHVFRTSANGASAVDLGVGGHPDVSPDGGTVVFQRRPKSGAPWQLYKVASGGGSATRLTNNRNLDRDPSFLADGRIIFTRCGSDGRDCSIQLVTLSGVAAGTVTAGSRGRGRQASGTLMTEDLLGSRFRPILRFDSKEQWRPLEIESFFAEDDPQAPGTPLNRLCVATDPPSTVPPCYRPSSASMAAHNAPENYLTLKPLSPLYSGESYVYRSPYVECNGALPSGGSVKDCNAGSRSAVYYHSTVRSAGYNYVDYWWYYRYNHFVSTDYDHEGDWEGVTVAPSPSGNTFDWVAFAQHSHKHGTEYYLREGLRCDDGADYSCGTTNPANPYKGKRVWAYVAEGTHATYPVPCSVGCFQELSGAPEGGHDGQVPWGNNVDDAAYRALPNPVSGQWVDWKGTWGFPRVDAGTPPVSPGRQRRYICPWEGNPQDATACSASLARAARTDRAASRCGSWFGGSVAVLVCDQRRLERGVERGTLGGRGDVRALVRGRRGAAATAPGIAQFVGRPLRVGSVVHITGRLRRTMVVRLHVRRKRHLYTASFALPSRSRAATVRVVRRGDGIWVEVARRGGGDLRARAARVT